VKEGEDLSFLKCIQFIYFFFIFIFLNVLFIHESQREAAAEGEGEAGSPLSREPDAGLDPRTLGS